jgi:cobalt-zinc-cadmium efflux system membrane fusion protein
LRSSLRDIGRSALKHGTTLLTLAGLAAVAGWGYETDWRLASPFAAGQAPDGKGDVAPPIRVTAGPPPSPATSPSPVRATVTFASADDVTKAGFEFARAEARPVTRYVDATASVGYDPDLYAQLASRAAGTVWWVQKVPGQPVARGEVLALMDVAEVGKLKADILTALTQLDLENQTVEQLTESRGSVPERSVREAVAAAANTRTKLAADRQALLNLGLAADPDELRKLPPADRVERVRFLGLTDEARSHALCPTASANLVPVASPLDGAVVRRTVTRGEAVAANKPLFVVASVRRVHLELAVEPRDADLLALGQEVQFTPEATPDFTARGTLAHVVPEVDEATRKVWAHAEAGNPDGRLRPNSFGRARVVVATDPGAVVVPEAAVQPDGGGHVLFVRTGDTTFEARRVKPGLADGGLRAVSGVRAGESVVTVGGHALAAELRRDQLGGGE